MWSFDNTDKLPHSATAKSITEENTLADSLNAPEAKKILIKYSFTYKVAEHMYS
jgi:hypothetical protein